MSQNGPVAINSAPNPALNTQAPVEDRVNAQLNPDPDENDFSPKAEMIRAYNERIRLIWQLHSMKVGHGKLALFFQMQQILLLTAISAGIGYGYSFLTAFLYQKGWVLQGWSLLTQGAHAMGLYIAPYLPAGLVPFASIIAVSLPFSFILLNAVTAFFTSDVGMKTKEKSVLTMLGQLALPFVTYGVSSWLGFTATASFWSTMFGASVAFLELTNVSEHAMMLYAGYQKRQVKSELTKKEAFLEHMKGVVPGHDWPYGMRLAQPPAVQPQAGQPPVGQPPVAAQPAAPQQVVQQPAAQPPAQPAQQPPAQQLPSPQQVVEQPPARPVTQQDLMNQMNQLVNVLSAFQKAQQPAPVQAGQNSDNAARPQVPQQAEQPPAPNTKARGRRKSAADNGEEPVAVAPRRSPRSKKK